MHFDHVAVAARNANGVVKRLCSDLGAVVIMGGTPPMSGFRSVQVRIGRGETGMTIEVLEPFETEHNDFLERFLARGDAPHHITFKVDDIEKELERLRGLGIEPVGIDFRYEYWKELFIHPSDAHGPVIQIAQAGYPEISMLDLLAMQDRSGVGFWDQWWEDAAAGPLAFTMERAVIETPDLAAAKEFYGGLLEGEVEGDTVSWPGGVLLLEETDVGRPRLARADVTGPERADVTAGGLRFLSPK